MCSSLGLYQRPVVAVSRTHVSEWTEVARQRRDVRFCRTCKGQIQKKLLHGLQGDASQILAHSKVREKLTRKDRTLKVLPAKEAYLQLHWWRRGSARGLQR